MLRCFGFMANRPSENQRIVDKARRLRNYNLVQKAKCFPCGDCGQRFPSCCMDFDHVRGMKRMTVSRGATTGKSIQWLKEEMAKCDVICANCHRIRTWGK